MSQKVSTKVEELHLKGDKNTETMGKKQGQAIFDAIAVGPGKLKRLSISYAPWLDRVCSDKLACAANRLEGFGLYDTYLSQRKIEKILTKALDGTRLKRLDLSGRMGGLDPILVSQAREVIPAVTFWP